MLLRNFARVIFSNVSSSIASVTCTATGEPVLSPGLQRYAPLTSLVSVAATGYTQNSAAHTSTDHVIFFGNGTTPPTVDDYCLAGDLLNGSLTRNSHSISYAANGVTLTINVSNKSTENITISELAWGTSCTAGAVIYTRDVITPVTLAPSEGRTFSIFIDTMSFVTSAASS